MKTGILTFSNALNPGAVLQAFSLYKALEEAGHEATLIDYRCQAIEAMHQPRPVLRKGPGPKARLYNLVYNLVFLPRRFRYASFARRMRKSGPYTRETVKKADGCFDLFISGSDQVFNLKLTGYDTTYYLDFVHKGKKASFAAGTGIYSPEEAAVAGACLSSFDYLSVRENRGKDQLRKLCGLDCQVIPDPVFLHTADEWRRLLDIKKKKTQEYVLIYSLYENTAMYAVAGQAARKYGLKTVLITRVLRPRYQADRIVRNAGPRELLDLVANASYIVTNSFHGTAFSVIFKKPFTSVVTSLFPERIEELLEQTHLSDRIFRADSSQSACLDPVNREDAAKASGLLRQKGLDFIKEMTQGRG